MKHRLYALPVTSAEGTCVQVAVNANVERLALFMNYIVSL